jgi:NitT/TauT family transport system substrate-binding protein
VKISITKRGFKNVIFKPLLFFLLVISLSSCAKKPSGKPRVAYLLNITHAVPIVAIEKGLFGEYEVEHYVSGGYLLNSLMSKNIDIAYIGPGPYINAINKGFELELLTVSAVGANAFVVSEKFRSDKNFKIKKIAVPQYGNTQDLLARNLISRLEKSKTNLPNSLKEIANDSSSAKALNFDEKVEYLAVSPSELEMVLHRNSVDAALTAEPWGTLLTQRGFINLNAEMKEQTLLNSPDEEYETNLRKELDRINDFPVTLLVVRKDYYKTHAREVEDFIKKNNQALEVITKDTNSAIECIQKHFERIAHKTLAKEMLITSLSTMSFDSKIDIEKLDELEDVAIAAKYFRKKKIYLANSK